MTAIETIIVGGRAGDFTGVTADCRILLYNGCFNQLVLLRSLSRLLLFNNLAAKVNTFVADIYSSWPCNEALYLILRLATEGAVTDRPALPTYLFCIVCHLFVPFLLEKSSLPNSLMACSRETYSGHMRQNARGKGAQTINIIEVKPLQHQLFNSYIVVGFDLLDDYIGCANQGIE